MRAKDGLIEDRKEGEHRGRERCPVPLFPVSLSLVPTYNTVQYVNAGLAETTANLSVLVDVYMNDFQRSLRDSAIDASCVHCTRLCVCERESECD